MNKGMHQMAQRKQGINNALKIEFMDGIGNLNYYAYVYNDSVDNAFGVSDEMFDSRSFKSSMFVRNRCFNTACYIIERYANSPWFDSFFLDLKKAGFLIRALRSIVRHGYTKRINHDIQKHWDANFSSYFNDPIMCEIKEMFDSFDRMNK